MKTRRQRKAGTTCTRCGERRWPFRDWPAPYACQRCQEALRGGRVVEPRPTEAQRVARAANLGQSFGQQGGVGAIRGSGEVETGTAPR